MEDNRPSYRLEMFEGPLDLLLSLIAKNQIDIYDIPIAEIFDQYTAYLEKMKELDMEIAAEFLAMASQLMLIKSRMLLPKEVVDGEEIDPREDLVRTLLEYRRAKEEARFLGDRYAVYFGRYTKETDEVGVDRTYVEEQQTAYLLSAMERMMERFRLEERMQNKDASKTLASILTNRPASIKERTAKILTLLRKKQQVGFLELMTQCRTRSEIVASFMAVLALIARQKIGTLYQESAPDDPVIVLLDDGARDDPDGAAGEDRDGLDVFGF